MEITNGSPALTEQLRRYSGGDEQIADAVLREILPRLHQIAVRELRRERHIAPLSATELIHEVWLRNLRRGGWQIESREHFYAFAALAMRHALVDMARNRLAGRRGEGKTPLSLEDNNVPILAGGSDPETIVHIGMLMEQLERKDREVARVVDMHYFAGFTLEEIAEITGLTFRQVRHRWGKGRDWLKDRLRKLGFPR